MARVCVCVCLCHRLICHPCDFVEDKNTTVKKHNPTGTERDDTHTHTHIHTQTEKKSQNQLQYTINLKVVLRESNEKKRENSEATS